MPATPDKLKKVKEHPLFAELTEMQQKFIISYLETGDKVKSVYASGSKAKNDEVANFMALKNLKHTIIKQLIALGLGIPNSGGELSKKELLLILSEHIRKCKNQSVAYRLMVIFINVKQWTVGNDMPDTGEIVKHLETMRTKEEPYVLSKQHK